MCFLYLYLKLNWKFCFCTKACDNDDEDGDDDNDGFFLRYDWPKKGVKPYFYPEPLPRLRFSPSQISDLLQAGFQTV